MKSTIITITGCHSCPFMNMNSEYGNSCNYPLSKVDFLKQDKRVSQLKTSSTKWGFYHAETPLIPRKCPLKILKLIEFDSKILLQIKLDKRLFEEKFI